MYFIECVLYRMLPLPTTVRDLEAHYSAILKPFLDRISRKSNVFATIRWPANSKSYADCNFKCRNRTVQGHRQSRSLNKC